MYLLKTGGGAATHRKNTERKPLETLDSGFNRKRHAEKVVTRHGVIVKIELVADVHQELSEKASVHKPGSVCVHIFKDYNFRYLHRTFYGADAIKKWEKVLRSQAQILPRDLTSKEFRQMMYEVKKCTLTSDNFFMNRKAVSSSNA